jgi:YCII-related domain
MQQLFVVIRTRGPAWQDSRPMESQADWAPHASFMNSLAKEGFVILGGPLEGSADVLLVTRAKTPDEVRSRLADDPWAVNDLLRITRVAPWTVRLGSLE